MMGASVNGKPFRSLGGKPRQWRRLSISFDPMLQNGPLARICRFASRLRPCQCTSGDVNLQKTGITHIEHEERVNKRCIRGRLRAGNSIRACERNQVPKWSKMTLRGIRASDEGSTAQQPLRVTHRPRALIVFFRCLPALRAEAASEVWQQDKQPGPSLGQ